MSSQNCVHLDADADLIAGLLSVWQQILLLLSARTPCCVSSESQLFIQNHSTLKLVVFTIQHFLFSTLLSVTGQRQRVRCCSINIFHFPTQRHCQLPKRPLLWYLCVFYIFYLSHSNLNSNSNTNRNSNSFQDFFYFFFILTLALIHVNGSMDKFKFLAKSIQISVYHQQHFIIFIFFLLNGAPVHGKNYGGPLLAPLFY